MKITSIYILCSIMLLFYLPASSQSPVIRVSWNLNEVLINGKPIDRNTTIATLHNILGKESREMSEPGNPTRLYIYDQLGINFIVDTMQGILKKMDMYVSKGKREFSTSPQQLYNGEFHLNNVPIHFTYKIDEIKEKTKVPFEALSPGYYWFLASKDDFHICVAYTNSKQTAISMVYILFDKME